jgi:predicted AAA+ superfamily ATPase
MEREMKQVVRQKITDALAAPVPAHTRRDVYVPAIKGKALAVIGMRRSGKTTFLWQCLADRLAAGTPRDALLYFNFEDERLAEMTTQDLQLVVEEYYSLHPERRDAQRVTLFLDEIQSVPGWEAFVRRLLDTEKVELFLSGSSARLLSREVATSMRGRAMEVLVHPFSLREALRHRGVEPQKPWDDLPKAARSTLDKHFRAYLTEGGFPESQGVPARDRASLLRTYVDVAILRDVIERHSVSNPAALRWLQRHLLGNPAAPFSVQKFFDALKSQGLPVGRTPFTITWLIWKTLFWCVLFRCTPRPSASAWSIPAKPIPSTRASSRFTNAAVAPTSATLSKRLFSSNSNVAAAR